MTNEQKFTGVVVEIAPLQIIPSKDGTKEYRKQELVLEESDGQYPKSILLEAFGDKAFEAISGVVLGDEVEVFYNSRAKGFDAPAKDGKPARRWLQCSNSIWKVNKISTESPFQSAPAPIAANPFETANMPAPTEEGADDLPF